MKIALIGATGMIGQRILQEALTRGHEVTAVVRDPSKLNGAASQVTVKTGDVLDADSIAAAITGQDVVISAYGPGMSGPQENFVVAAQALVSGLTEAGVSRLLIVGGAGSLEVAPGVRLVDTPGIPEAWKPAALAQADALAFYRTADLDWTYFSPAGMIQPGERTGKYRTGGDQLVVDSEGNSTISCEDYAIALLEEIENPVHIRQRFTAAY